jgi:outer membrane protein W
MQKIFLAFLTFLFVSSISLAELKLKLPAEITGEATTSIINKNIEQNLKLSVPEAVVPPADMKELVKGMIMLGILADVSFPMGSDDGFGHIAGTGFSGHVLANYMIAASWMLSLRAGYIAFGTQTEEGGDQFSSYKYEDTYSQIPILLGAYYMFATSSGFKPFIGAALGVFIQNYSYTWTFTSNFGGQTFTDTQEGDASSTGFGVVPGAGFYYLLGSIMLVAAVEYAYIFSELPTEEEEEYTPPLSKMTRIAQEEEETTEKASYISVNLGVAFPLGN